MPYKKRRITKSPNKNEERSLRSQSSHPLLKEFYPEVSSLVLELRFLNRQGHLLQDERMEFSPSDPVNFMAACPGGCNDGQTNLQGKIDSVVRQHLSVGEGRAQCNQQLFSNSDLCGCEIQCRINVEY